MDEITALLGLTSVSGLGQKRIRKLIGAFGSAQKSLEASFRDIIEIEGFDISLATQIKHGVDERFAEEQVKLAEKHDTHIIPFWDERYPALLKNIYDPPLVLYARGRLVSLTDKTISIVGMRASSQYGKWCAGWFAENLASNGIAVISGGARGVDTSAHLGALKGKGLTVSVLGCGVDVIYPPENAHLNRKILESGGAIISEFPMKTEPLAGHFPRRNRIIAGLSRGTLVIEAGEKSGALITAYMALDQGRDVFALPGDIRSIKSRGTHKLIKQGAKLVENVNDILNEYTDWVCGTNHKKDEKAVLKRITSEEKKIFLALSSDPLHIDKIAETVEKNTSETLALLLSLELKGCVKQISGMLFVRE